MHAAVEVRATGFFGDVIVGVERTRGVAAGRGKYGALNPKADGSARLHTDSNLRQPEPEVAGAHKLRRSQRA